MSTDADEQAQKTSLPGLRTVSLLTLASRILGFARDAAMAAVFGLGEILDAFTLAFRIPNLARSLFGEGALAIAFLPAFVTTETEHGVDAARRMATAVTRRLGAALALVVVFAEVVLAVLHRSAASPYQIRLIELLALMMPYLLLICLTAQAGAMLQAQRRFLWPAFAPVLLNLCWLTAVGITAWTAIDPERRIRWIAASLVLGGILQLVLPAAVLYRLGWSPLAPDADARRRAVGVFRAMAPTILAATIAQFNTVLDSAVAWVLASPAATAWAGGRTIVEPGTAAALYFAQRLYQFPLGLIGVAVGTVLFPVLSAHAARRDTWRLKSDLTHGLIVALSVGIPASAGLVILAGPVTLTLFRHGNFNTQDALLTSRIMAIYGSVAWAAIALLLMQRGFFAIGDRATPLKTAFATALVNLLLTPLGAWWYGGIGLACATSMSMLFQCGLALWLLQRHDIAMHWPLLMRRVGRTLVATAALVLVCGGVSLALQEARPTIVLTASMAAGVVTFLGVGHLIGLHEPWELLSLRRKRQELSATAPEASSLRS